MLIKRCCSLCCTSCTEYEFLQNNIGESNKIYEITVKYFDPMLLTDEKTVNSEHRQVLCEDCWSNINDFHEFQQTVLKTRTLFEHKEGIKILSIEVKQEDGPGNEAISTQASEKFCMKATEAVLNDDYVENLHFKAESPNSAQYSHDEQLSALEEEEESLKETVKNYPSPTNASTVNSGATTTASCENTQKRPIKESKHQTKSEHELPVRAKRIRKPKDKLIIKSYGSTHENDEETSRKSPEIAKEKEGSSLNLRKARELDAFIAEWKPELNCDLCTVTTNNFDRLRSHFKEKHKIKFYIRCCEKKFFRRYDFANHIQLHLDPNTHKCEICGKSSASKKNLKLHKKLMHELTKQLKCDICEKLFKQKVTLTRHLLTHSTGNKDFICSECGKGFVAEQLLKLHIKNVHNADRVCDQCGKTIHGLQAYKKHLMEHAGIERVKFTCDICSQKFTTSNGLKKHKAAYHNDGTTIYVCRVCGKVASSENALLNHKRLVHVEERRHKCTYCEKAFKRPLALREHIASHTGQDLYQCPHCPQTFKVSSNMHHHRKKVHPVEWAEGRKNRLQHPKIISSRVKKQVVM